jgi:5-methylcytosine-specific restriction enzyme subunit McrC
MPVINEPLAIREHEELKGLCQDELRDLKDFALENRTDVEGNYRPVLELKNNRLYAQNYVGIIETHKGTVLEILPKVDFAEDTEETKKVFFEMLRFWRGFKSLAQFNLSHINAVQRFNMLEVFVHLFLNNLVLLTQRGLARHYHSEEDNQPYLRGRILFPQHIRENVANRARFYVSYDEFSANRPANRLIHSTIHKLMGSVRQPRNQQLLHQLRISFSDIPQSEHPKSDWDRHQVDRSIQHYDEAMQWVGLFLFDHGLTTFAGKHVNQTLLFPMWEVFEDFVVASFRRYQRRFSMRKQGPREPLAHIDGKGVFYMKPDISLMSDRMSDRKTEFILDTKWKRINGEGSDPKHGISQADMYQLFAYGKKYRCKQVALIYPKSEQFQEMLRYKFDEELSLSCFPFNVTKPKCSVKKILNDLQNKS